MSSSPKSKSPKSAAAKSPKPAAKKKASSKKPAAKKAPAAPAAAAAASGKKGASKKSKSTKNKRPIDFSIYTLKVLKQVHPAIGITRKGMAVMQDVLSDVAVRLADSVSTFVAHADLGTVSKHQIQGATRSVLPGELSKHAVSEGTKAVAKEAQFRADQKAFIEGENSNAKQMADDEGKLRWFQRAKEGKWVQIGSRVEAHAGLQFSVSRAARVLKRNVKVAKRIGYSAKIFMAAVIEYISAEILELAGNAASDLKKKRITPRAITLAIRNDQELNVLFPFAIASGGVLPVAAIAAKKEAAAKAAKKEAAAAAAAGGKSGGKSGKKH